MMMMQGNSSDVTLDQTRMVYICVIMIMIIQNNDTMVVVVVKRVSF